MKILDEMPLDGQFVMLWTYEGLLWSDIFRYVNGVLMKYFDEIDDFEKVNYLFDNYQNIKYVIL